jgi:hypothetical protein
MRAAAKASAAAKGVPTFRHAGITVRITVEERRFSAA